VEPMPLIAGLDYLDTYRSFVEIFPDNTACAAYLAKLRWPQGFVYPACETNAIPWRASRGRPGIASITKPRPFYHAGRDDENFRRQ
jgi:hypothetical protein